MSFIIHIGTPRTGTTVLQKHLFPKSKNYFLIQKHAYAATGNLIDKEKGIVGGDLRQCILQLQSLKVPVSADQATDFLNNLLIPSIIIPSDPVTRLSRQDLQRRALLLCIKRLLQTSSSLSKSIFISTERFCDTAASLRGHSKPFPDHESEFLLYALLRGIQEFSGDQAKLTLCLRDPVRYLRSKYIRTHFMRRVVRERDLTPAEYIQKQASLEVAFPGASVLAPAMHTEFIKQLQQHAFVKAFGFQELLASDDIFSLMGLQGEGKYAFRDLPRENKFPVAEEQEKAIETEITQALKQYGFYDRIMRSQMFE